MAIDIENPGSDGPQLVSALATLFTGLAGVPLGVQYFSTLGDTTYTKTPGTTHVLVWGQGSGGGGGGVGTTSGVGRGGIGGNGETRLGVFDIANDDGITVTIASGGLGGASGNNDGSAAGDSTFGTYMTCKGGKGGSGSTGSGNGSNGAAPDTGSGGVSLVAIGSTPVGYLATPDTGTFAITGSIPLAGMSLRAQAVGNGIAGPFGRGGNGGHDTGTTARSGGVGGRGYFIVIEFGIPQPPEE